jgi:hypothetical protein
LRWMVSFTSWLMNQSRCFDEINLCPCWVLNPDHHPEASHCIDWAVLANFVITFDYYIVRNTVVYFFLPEHFLSTLLNQLTWWGFVVLLSQKEATWPTLLTVICFVRMYNISSFHRYDGLIDWLVGSLAGWFVRWSDGWIDWFSFGQHH